MDSVALHVVGKVSQLDAVAVDSMGMYNSPEA